MLFRDCQLLFFVEYLILSWPLFVCYRNGSHISLSKEEGPKLNGIHDGNPCNSSTTFLKGSKDNLQKNGYVHPLNGALKQANSSCSKSTHQGAEFRYPQTKAEEMGTSSCSSPGGLASDFTASLTSTSLPQSPSRATHHERISDSFMLSEPSSETITSIQEKQVYSEKLLGQDQISQVRLNGSHHITSNVTLTGKHTAQGPETGIISEFFSRSRLHHISTWRNEFSEYVNTLQSRRRAAGGAVFPGKDKLKKLTNDRSAGNGINCSLCVLFVSEFYCDPKNSCSVCLVLFFSVLQWFAVCVRTRLIKMYFSLPVLTPRDLTFLCPATAGHK